MKETMTSSLPLTKYLETTQAKTNRRYINRYKGERLGDNNEYTPWKPDSTLEKDYLSENFDGHL